MPKPPKISVILTSFNHGSFIRKAIDSVLNQTFTDFELIVWDDASQDDSWEVICSYNDSRIRRFRNAEARRAVYGINKAISEVAQGEYIAIHHSDDVWIPHKLEKQVAALDHFPDTGATFTWVKIIDEHGSHHPEDQRSDWFNRKSVDRWQLLRELFFGDNHLNHPSILIRKSCYEKVGPYKYGLAQTGDAELWSRLLLEYEVVVLEEPLVMHRLFSDGSNISGAANSSAIRTQNEWNVLRRNFLECGDYESLARIFPEAVWPADLTRENVNHALALISLNQSLPPSAWEFGLDILYRQITSDDWEGNHSGGPAFDYRRLIRESGNFDVFNVRAGNEIPKYVEEISRLVETLSESHRQVADLTVRLNEVYSSPSWRLTGALRWIGRRLREVISSFRS